MHCQVIVVRSQLDCWPFCRLSEQRMRRGRDCRAMASADLTRPIVRENFGTDDAKYEPGVQKKLVCNGRKRWEKSVAILHNLPKQ